MERFIYGAGDIFNKVETYEIRDYLFPGEFFMGRHFNVTLAESLVVFTRHDHFTPPTMQKTIFN